MSVAGWAALRDALREVAAGQDRVLVLTGAGADFCSGADLSAGGSGRHPLVDMRLAGATCLAGQTAQAAVFAHSHGLGAPGLTR